MADRWLALLRPAVQLVPATGRDRVVARMGGLPRLPDDTDWPVWDGHGPLCFVAELDLVALADQRLDADIPLPDRGRLLFFLYDNPDDGTNTVTFTVWDNHAVARMLYLPEVADGVLPTAAPGGAAVYPERLLTGRQILTQPGWEHPRLEAEFRTPGAEPRQWYEHPVMSPLFFDAVHGFHGEPVHQVGGWADSIQYPVEHEIAHCALNRGPDFSDAASVAEEARHWRLLLQIDSEPDPMWGDGGKLYWLARTDHLAAGDLSQVLFATQCH
jgi:hypothetical protein